MADESQNPFVQAMKGERYPQFIEEGTAMGTITNIGNLLWGKPLATRKSEFEARERAYLNREEKAAAASERKALSEIIGLVGEVRDANPQATTAELSRRVFTDKRFTANAMSVDSKKMTALVGDVLKMLENPAAPKPMTVAEGAALVSPDGRQLYKNEKAAELDPRSKAEQAALAKRSIDQLGKISEAGQSARMDELNIAELERLGDKIGTGGAAAIRGYFSRIGVDLGDASDINAFEALVDRLAPQMRQPGSGSSSDRDVVLFKSALPSLIRTPEGNKQIISTLKAMNKHRLKEADIADQVFDGTLTVPQGLRELRKLPSPLEGFKASQAGKKPQSSFDAPATVTPSKRLRFNPETGQLEPVR